MNPKTKWISISIIISLIVICFIFVLYNSQQGNESLLNKASAINLYESGNKVEVIKKTELYNNIVELIDMEFPDIYGIDSPISNEEFITIKNFSVEFVFGKPETIEANTAEGRKQMKIMSIIFPLDDQREYQAYVTTDEGLNYFIGNRHNLQTLVKNTVPTYK